ncbi:MAG: BrnT family toxin [Methylococcales bacterium]
MQVRQSLTSNVSNIFRLIFDPFLQVVDASQNDQARDAIIGMDKQWSLLFIVHLLIEENDVIRIISARKATRTERGFYEN